MTFNKLARLLGGAVGLSGVALLAGNPHNDLKLSIYSKFLLKAEENVKPGSATKWNSNWDAREEESTLNPPKVSRNIILVRHGQYNLEGKEDDERYLTELGLEQAKLTGSRLAEMGLPYTSITVSKMKRAIQTADLIHDSLPQVPLHPQDGILNEGAPVKAEPRGSWRPDYHSEVDGARIEAAFRKYFHRAKPSQTEDSYEIIVCHANVIRYFLMRALQLPPEAWLRFSLRHASFTWIVIRPDGNVHCKFIGESGHFPVDKLSVT